MYTTAQYTLETLPDSVRNRIVHMSDGTRPTVEEIMSGRPATAPAEAPDNNEFALVPLLEIEILGTESTIGELLEIDSPKTRAILARHGIRLEAGVLHLNLTQDPLLRLLISPSLREPGARLDTKTGTLVLPFSVA